MLRENWQMIMKTRCMKLKIIENYNHISLKLYCFLLLWLRTDNINLTQANFPPQDFC